MSTKTMMLALLFSLTITSALVAQSDSSSAAITGMVRDDQGGLLPV